MKKLPIIFILLVCVLTFSWKVPTHNGYLNDYLNLFNSAESNEIRALLNNIEAQTSVEIAVVTLSTDDSITPKDMATEIFNTWNIGKADKDNGLLILIALDPLERAGKSRVEIETGYGLEGVLPDGKVGRIMDDYMMSYLSQKQYGKAVISVINAISGVITGELEINYNENEESFADIIWILIFIPIIIIGAPFIAYLSKPKCPRCSKRMSVMKNIVLVRATYSSSGKGQRFLRCRHCNYQFERLYTIPRKTHSSGSSSGSSGGSFGGGSSGGGGAGRSF